MVVVKNGYLHWATIHQNWLINFAINHCRIPPDDRVCRAKEEERRRRMMELQVALPNCGADATGAAPCSGFLLDRWIVRFQRWCATQLAAMLWKSFCSHEWNIAMNLPNGRGPLCAIWLAARLLKSLQFAVCRAKKWHDGAWFFRWESIFSFSFCYFNRLFTLLEKGIN